MTSKSAQFLFVWRKRLFRLSILFFSSRGGESEASGWRSIVVARSCKVFSWGIVRWVWPHLRWKTFLAQNSDEKFRLNFPTSATWWKFPRLNCAGSDPFHQFHWDEQLVVVSRIYFGWINFWTEIMLSRVQSCGLLANRGVLWITDSSSRNWFRSIIYCNNRLTMVLWCAILIFQAASSHWTHRDPEPTESSPSSQIPPIFQPKPIETDEDAIN